MNKYKNFPRAESFTDCAGIKREFEISQIPHCIDMGFIVKASEITTRNNGYEFSSWSPSLGDALGKLRLKIKEGLATKYLEASPFGGLSISHNKMSGRLRCDGVVVDGVFIDWESFKSLLITHEGFQFKLSVADACD